LTKEGFVIDDEYQLVGSFGSGAHSGELTHL
jgi:hypothetical protein